MSQAIPAVVAADAVSVAGKRSVTWSALPPGRGNTTSSTVEARRSSPTGHQVKLTCWSPTAPMRTDSLATVVDDRALRAGRHVDSASSTIQAGHAPPSATSSHSCSTGSSVSTVLVISVMRTG